MEYLRKDHELPLAIDQWGWRYHHLGLPTQSVMPNEIYLEKFRLYVSGFDTSPFGVEWMRYEEGSPIADIIKNNPHIAFEVDNLDYELQRHNFKVITPPNSPGSGIRVAMIEHSGAIIELIEFENPN